MITLINNVVITVGRFFLIFVAQKVSNIHLVTKDFKIVPLTNLLKLLLTGRVIGGGVVCIVRFILMQQ